jgi:hypothetical protein
MPPKRFTRHWASQDQSCARGLFPFRIPVLQEGNRRRHRVVQFCVDKEPLTWGSVAQADCLLRREAPAHNPVLGLHLVAPAECAGPIAEVSKPQRTAVDEPYDDRSVRTRTNHRVRQQAIGAPHSPHDSRLVIHQSHRSFGHASPTGKSDTSPSGPLPH